MRTLLKNGAVVNETGAVLLDVMIEDGLIVTVAPSIDTPWDCMLDLTGQYIFPGFIDTHTHFDLDLTVTVTADSFKTGTRAAVLGGTTTVLDFATQDRGMTMGQALELWHKKAAGASCNYGFHMAVSEWDGNRIAEIGNMIDKGVTSFKMYMVYDAMRVNDGQIYNALKRTAARDCIVGVHCENFDVLNERIRELKGAGILSPAGHPMSRPNGVEAEAIARLMRIAQMANAPAWVVHLSTHEGLEEALRARNRGQEVYLETCPQYLTLTDERYNDPDGAKFIMSPPLRKKEDQLALLSAMHRDEIDVVGTDHCSFTMAQKALGKDDFSKIPNGGAGVQNRAELIYTYGVTAGYLTLSQMAAQLSTNAAKLFGMYPQRGVIAPGSQADITVYQPKGERRISWRTNAHNCDNSPYEDLPVTGGVSHVFVNGVHVVEEGSLTTEGTGKYVFRGPSMRPRK